jgi:hypothetical protein
MSEPTIAAARGILQDADRALERQRGPCSEPLVTGISPLVKEQLSKIGINPSIKQRIAEHLEKKGERG